MARQPQAQPSPSPVEPVTTAAGPPAFEAGGILTINLDAIHSNYRTVAGRVLPGECAAVVKADAYGHGMGPVARAARAHGAAWLGVALPSEALALRDLGKTVVRAPFDAKVIGLMMAGIWED